SPSTEEESSAAASSTTRAAASSRASRSSRSCGAFAEGGLRKLPGGVGKPYDPDALVAGDFDHRRIRGCDRLALDQRMRQQQAVGKGERAGSPVVVPDAKVGCKPRFGLAGDDRRQ